MRISAKSDFLHFMYAVILILETSPSYTVLITRRADSVCDYTKGSVTFDRGPLSKLVERGKFTDARQHRLGLQGRDHRPRPSQQAAADPQTAGSDSATEPRWDKQASLIDRDPLL